MTRADREMIVVCRVNGTAEKIEAGLSNVREHTAPEIAIVVVAGPADRRAAARALEHAGERMRLSDTTDPAALAAGLAPADLAIVDLPCRVTVGWLDGLRSAAGDGAEVAVAVALDISSLGRAPRLSSRTATVRRGARVPPTAARCRFIRRSAIELVGAADLGPGLMTRMQQAGLACILAEDVLVSGDVSRPTAGPAAERALDAVRRERTGLRVLVDARCLGSARDGTRTHVLGLLGALAGTELRVTALVPARLDTELAAALEPISGLDLVRLTASGLPPDGLRADVVHRPYQIAADAELVALARMGERLVITHQDLISYHQREYFASESAWRGYREMTRRALQVADHVAFFSAHVREEALAEGLVEPHRASVTPLGADGPVQSTHAQPPVRPPSVGSLPDEAEMILCLGSDFVHKNRRFALQVAHALQRDHGWTGRLVFAGPRVSPGSSRRGEAEDLAADPRLGEAVLDAGEVTGPQRAWLLARCSLVMYPTVQEGFGLIPFEAAAVGRPCLWAAGSALAELLPVAAAEIVAWDPVASAQGALALMRDASRRQANIDAVLGAATELSWERAGATIAALYADVCAAMPNPAGQLGREQGLIGTGLSEDAIRLVGPGGALPRDVERPLLALATHRGVARPVFAALGALYRLGRGRGRGARGGLIPGRK